MRSFWALGFGRGAHRDDAPHWVNVGARTVEPRYRGPQSCSKRSPPSVPRQRGQRIPASAVSEARVGSGRGATAQDRHESRGASRRRIGSELAPGGESNRCVRFAVEPRGPASPNTSGFRTATPRIESMSRFPSSRQCSQSEPLPQRIRITCKWIAWRGGRSKCCSSVSRALATRRISRAETLVSSAVSFNPHARRSCARRGAGPSPGDCLTIQAGRTRSVRSSRHRRAALPAPSVRWRIRARRAGDSARQGGAAAQVGVDGVRRLATFADGPHHQ